MRRSALWLAFLLTTTQALPSLAQDDFSDSTSPGPTIEVRGAAPTPLSDTDWGETVSNRYKIGVNSLITFPADLVMSTVEPDEEWDELPLSVVTKYPVGFVQGSLLMIHRATAGTFDLVFAPVTPMRMLSPEPRYLLFADAEHEEY